jgi:hypothetical protein
MQTRDPQDNEFMGPESAAHRHGPPPAAVFGADAFASAMVLRCIRDDAQLILSWRSTMLQNLTPSIQSQKMVVATDRIVDSAMPEEATPTPAL